MSIHQIKGNWSTKEVWIDGNSLSPAKSQKVWNHSPDGFNWSYGGSGPAQLALAILLEFVDKKLAIDVYQEFKWKYIATLPQANFEINLDMEGFEPKNVPDKKDVIRALEF